MTYLTEKEAIVLMAAVLVNTTVESADEDDFFSFFYPKEIVDTTELSSEQVAGVLSSLSQKGLVSEEESANKAASATEWTVEWSAIELLRASANQADR